MSAQIKRLKEADRINMIAHYLKTKTQPEGYFVKEDDKGGYRVTAVKIRDPEEEKRKKRDRYIKKLLEVDPSLVASFFDAGIPPGATLCPEEKNVDMKTEEPI